MNVQQYTPIINNTELNFSSRDCLGIENVAASISAQLCPIVNTVTPRAFYWPFMVWLYYDFIFHSGITERTSSIFDKEFLKHQDFFFVLATVIRTNGDRNDPDQSNLVGKDFTLALYDRDKEGPYSYDKRYFQTAYGGMQYYNAGCQTMRFITNVEGSRAFPKLTQAGKEMALAFESVIKDTEYFKSYRLKTDKPIPKNVLEEYGQVINMGLRGFDHCKRILRKHLFELKTIENQGLKESADYLLLINRELHKDSFDRSEMRGVLFDYFSPRGLNHSFPEALRDTIAGWEITIGRQYFTCGLEMIWKYMLAALKTRSMTFDEWAENVIGNSSINTIRNTVLRELLEKSIFTHDEYEQMIADARRNTTDKTITQQVVQNGLQIALSLYKRFKDRDDLGNAQGYLDAGKGRFSGMSSISFNEWINLVDQYIDRTVEDFLIYVMKNCIVDQHKRTCYDKMMRPTQKVNGYYFEYIDDVYIKNEHEFQVDFQGIRLMQLMQVMTDLDMF